MTELSRRELLERAAYTAGLAGAASILPANLLLQEAARGAERAASPPRATCPIDHFVVVMMENRSFDHYFGWLGETGPRGRLAAGHVPGPSRATRSRRVTRLRWAPPNGRAAAIPTRDTAGARAGRS